MNSYDIYRLYEGRTATKWSVECRDDLDALEAAKRETGPQALEVWDGRRFVARVKENDEALTAKDLHSL
jgi:hypothetical protein